jgi:hypothetical protein
MNEIAASDISSVSTGDSVGSVGGGMDLRNKVKQLLEIDNAILELKRKKAVLDKEKKTLTTQLLDWMKKVEVGEFGMANAVFTRRVAITKPLGKKSLIQVLKDYYKEEPEKGVAVKDYIFEHLPEKKTEKLLRFEKDNDET